MSLTVRQVRLSIGLQHMLIDLDQLEAHHANANRMSDAMLAKLADHIERSGQYPAIIVRRLEGSSAAGDGRTQRYQILDGHHRVLALRRLGRREAECDVWDHVDDDRAAILLLTLNRLRGEDDPHRRGELLAQLTSRFDLEELQRRLPDDIDRIRKLIDLSRAPSEAESRARAASVEMHTNSLPQALTIFLPAREHTAAIARLRSIDPDRRQALLIALGLANSGGRPAVG